ncbi:MAG: transposase [Caecibacter massiliensis]|nr:transposase [Caecibacter massiliensis]
MTKFNKQFKVDAITMIIVILIGCAHNLGISQQTLFRWQKQLRDNGEMPYRGSGNYASDEAKEIARLKRELRDAKDAKDAINVLKKAISILDK